MMIREELNQVSGVGSNGYSNPCIAKSIARNTQPPTTLTADTSVSFKTLPIPVSFFLEKSLIT